MSLHRSAALLAAAIVVSPDLSAQDPPSAQDPQPTIETSREAIEIPSDQDGREVLEITLFDALRLGRLNNLDLKTAELDPLQVSEDVRIAEAFFEPEAYAAAGALRSENPPRNIFTPQITRKQIDGRVGLRQRMVTGGLYDLSFTPVRQNTQAIGYPDDLVTMGFSGTVTQPLLRGAWSQSSLAEVRQSEELLTATKARFERTVQDTLLGIVDAYWELVFVREDYRVKYQALELAREQLRITNERIRVRELAERDRVFNEADVARRIEDLIRAENEIRQREDLLRQMLFDDSEGRLWQRTLVPISPIEGEFPAADEDWREASTRALRQRPDIAALNAEVRRAIAAYDKAWRDVLPQLDLTGNYGADAARATSHEAWDDLLNLEYPNWSVGLEMSIPIGNNAARGERDRQLLVLEQARRALYAAEVDVTREVRASIRDLNTLSQSIAAARESVRLSETQLDTERARLRVGRGTIFEVQQRNQELLDARQRLLRNQLDYRGSESQLLHAQGVLTAPGWGRSAGAEELSTPAPDSAPDATPEPAPASAPASAPDAATVDPDGSSAARDPSR